MIKKKKINIRTDIRISETKSFNFLSYRDRSDEIELFNSFSQWIFNYDITFFDVK